MDGNILCICNTLYRMQQIPHPDPSANPYVNNPIIFYGYYDNNSDDCTFIYLESNYNSSV